MAIKGKQLAADAVLAHKAGSILAVSFTGSPKKASVVFTTAFPNANYAVTASTVMTNDKHYMVVVESQTATGFTLSLGSNKTSDLAQANWIAIEHGESV